MRNDLWKNITIKLEIWGEYLANYECQGVKSWMGSLIEYGARVDRDTKESTVPIDSEKIEIHKVMLSVRVIDEKLYNIAFLENVWHHIEDVGEGRRKLKLPRILEILNMNKSTFYQNKRDLYHLLLGKIT